MINFIIINENYNEIKELIESIIMNYDYLYTVTNNTNKPILSNNNQYKIYIINSNSYYKLKRIVVNIRYNNNDWQSIIIVNTNKYTEVHKILLDECMVLSVINRDQMYKKRLRLCIEKALSNYDQRPKSLKYKYKNIYYRICFQEIMFIEKEKDNKRCIIHTNNNTYLIPHNLSKVQPMLDKRFIKCSRSYIINMEQVAHYDTKDNIINLNDGSIITEISRYSKQNIVGYFRNVE